MLRFGLGFWRNENGATAVEYGLLAALVAVAIIAGAAHVGAGVSDTFSTIENAM